MIILKGQGKYIGYHAAVTILDNKEAKITVLFPKTHDRAPQRAYMRIVTIFETESCINDPCLWIWQKNNFKIIKNYYHPDVLPIISGGLRK